MAGEISIFEHVRAHVRPDVPGLADGGETLPDEQEMTGVRWAPGAQDGVLTHHWAGKGDDDAAQRLSAAVIEAAGSKRGRRAKAAYEALYEAARTARIIPLVDDVLAAVRSSDVDPEGCYQVAYRLATEARHREPVKLGIALLGLFDASHHRDELMTLGRHDEFTLFAAVALGNREDGGTEADWWELARNTDGWGRVHLVERLSGTGNPELRNWILREGFRTGVMDAYLVGIAAETGGLADALAGDADDELLDAAADILTTLVEEGGPVEGMPAYADGERATALFLGHMTTRARELRHFLAVHDLHAYVRREWPDLVPRCTEILDRPLWRDLALRELRSSDDSTFFAAARACRILGVPTVRAYLDRLRAGDPYDSRAWFHAVEDAGDAEIDEVIALAAELLPLAEIASGPSGEVGMGPGFEPHGCLDMILQGLVRWPGRGLPLLLAGLASPAVRNRNMAVRALSAQDRDGWAPEVGDAVSTALAREPDQGVRGRLQALLDGRPIE